MRWQNRGMEKEIWLWLFTTCLWLFISSWENNCYYFSYTLDRLPLSPAPLVYESLECTTSGAGTFLTIGTVVQALTLVLGCCSQNPPSFSPSCVLSQTADQQYQDAFNDELESFKERVRGRAKIRIEKAMKEYEEEERQKRLGPGGLDPVDVYESLPAVSSAVFMKPQFSPLYSMVSRKIPHKMSSKLQEMQKCFDEKDIGMLQEVISKMDPTVGFLVQVYS